MKKALVHDWFSVYAGAEKCVESFTNIWDDFDVYSLIDFLTERDREIILKGKHAKTSFIQRLPFAKKKYRGYLAFFPLAIEQFDLREYDLIISSSHAVAKGVLTHADQLHISYIHTPMRYAWDLYHQYLRESGLDHGLKGGLAKLILHYIRLWDLSTVHRVDRFVANSHYIARRIKRVYGVNADVIYPPVDVEKFLLGEKKEDFYLTASRMVPYKKIDLIVETFSHLGKKLVVVGTGPDEKKIKSLAAKNVELLGYQSDEVLRDLMQRARAFVFAAEEDFGIVPVEAQACGTPVICLGRGGTSETVIDGLTGIHFENQSVNDLASAIERFEQMEDTFDPTKIRNHALQFSRQRFEEEFKKYVDDAYQQFCELRKK
ncbi:glycosyltransferase family 4 protein [Thermospira aquatica]|uniref:glycosyltransferase family 4 protein n=1 Tax=Thermospira aquatica TaxID=2828656 RepID=UPI0038CD9DC0